MSQASFALRGRNPDVLTCIANLSNDEVFTPPEIADAILDLIAEAWSAAHDGAVIWENKDVTFLDPFTKSGVFLRQIVARLTEGLAFQIPELKSRVDHILTRQVFGLGITSLTSLLARRSVYCSKNANSSFSIASSFKSHSGNIWFERTEHSWVGGEKLLGIDKTTGHESQVTFGGRCQFCGARQQLLDRGSTLESHAYAFIHTDDVKSFMTHVFGAHVKFDVIIGNPPYQMTGGGGGSNDSSIYHLFVEQAIKLDPMLLSMVIPSRWMAGGRGLDSFRESMLTDKHIRKLVDYTDSAEAFPGVQIKGGICYFLRDSATTGPCEVTRVTGGDARIQLERNLGEFDVFVRDERGLSILRKVLRVGEPSVRDLVSGDTPFGIATNFKGYTDEQFKKSVALHVIDGSRRKIGYIDGSVITKNFEATQVWKVLVPKAYGAGEKLPHQILGKELVVGPPSACSQSYLAIYPFSSEVEAQSFASYYRTKFFRFLVSLRKITQDALKSTYTWVPVQSWDRTWTDHELFKKYELDSEEIEYIDSVIKPMGETSE